MTTNENVEVPVSVPEQEPKKLDFEKIDALRKHMLLTVSSMAKVLKTTRVSYYNYLKGKPIRSTNVARMRKIVRQLVGVITEHNWPDEAVYMSNQKERLEMLQNLLEGLDKETAQ